MLKIQFLPLIMQTTLTNVMYNITSLTGLDSYEQ